MEEFTFEYPPWVERGMASIDALVKVIEEQIVEKHGDSVEGRRKAQKEIQNDPAILELFELKGRLDGRHRKPYIQFDCKND